MSHIKKMTITDFNCKVCGAPVVFDPTDHSTYISKDDNSESFFNMKLTRYVVNHETTDEQHINVVITDQNYKYRAHKDYYTKKKLFARNSFHLTIFQPKIQHSKIDYLILLNLNSKDVIEIINSVQIKTINVCDIFFFIFKDNKDIYTNIPELLTYDFVNRKFFLVRKSDDIFIICSFLHPEEHVDYLKVLGLIGKVITETNEHSATNIAIATMLRASENIKIQTQYEYLDWLMTENSIYIHLGLGENTIKNIQEFFSRFEDSSCVKKPDFMNIIEGKTTILEYLQNNVQDLCCTKDTFDILKRRIVITEDGQ